MKNTNKYPMQRALEAFKADEVTNLRQIQGGLAPGGAKVHRSYYMHRTAEYSKHWGPPIGYDDILTED
jgi:hypothetical protein